MPDALDELLAKIQQEHGPRAIYRPPAMVPARKWTSGLEARCKNERDDDEPITNRGTDGDGAERDPYSPDPALSPPEWLAEFARRCAEAVAGMNAAIERARDGR